MTPVQILGRDHVFVWECVKIAFHVGRGVLVLSSEDEFVDIVIFISLVLPPFETAHIGIENEPSP